MSPGVLPQQKLCCMEYYNYKKKSEIKVERYHQTFEDKNGFINDLCVLDLIFNYGPNAIDYLKRQACKPDSV